MTSPALARIRRSPVLAMIATLSAAPALALPQQLEPMSLDLKKIEVVSILKTFAQVAHSRLEKSPSIDGVITFRFDHLTWETALSAICESAGCRWQLEEGPERVLQVRALEEGEEKADRISLSLRDASVPQVLGAIARIQEVELKLDPAIEGRLTIDFTAVSVDTILTAVCENAGCEWHRRSGRQPVLEITKIHGKERANSSRTARDRLAGKIDIDLREAPVGEVLKFLAKVLEATPDIHPEVRGTVTLEISQGAVSEVLDHVATELFLRWSLAKGSSGDWSLTVRPIQGDFEPLGFQREPSPFRE